jgi:hypothetical protein
MHCVPAFPGALREYLAGALPREIFALTSLWEETLRTESENDEEHDMTGQNLISGIDLRSECLGTPRITPPTSVPPEIPEPADNDGFEGEDQSGRANRRIEICAPAIMKIFVVRHFRTSMPVASAMN